MVLNRVAGALIVSGVTVGAVGVVGPILVGWIQIFAIITLGLPESVDQLAWVGRVMTGAVLFELVTVPSGSVLLLFANALKLVNAHKGK